MTFNSSFLWDYAPPQIDPGAYCFQSVAAHEIGHVLGLKTSDHSREGVSLLAREIQAKLALNTVLVHPVAYALADYNAGRRNVVGSVAIWCDDRREKLTATAQGTYALPL